MVEQQSTLFDMDTAVETITKRETFLIRRLREYRVIDAEIKVQERLSKGIGLRHQPSITIRPPDEDDAYVLKRLQEPLSSGKQFIADTAKKHIGDKVSGRYAASYKVVRIARDSYAEDKDEDYAIRDLYDFMKHRVGEERVELTDTERLVDLRKEEMDRAKERCEILHDRKEIIGQALELLQENYPEWWAILYYKYVRGDHWKRVCEIAARDGMPLTEDEYLWARRKALRQFDKWAIGLC